MKKDLKTVLVTDCGSTTTKALLFERTEEGWRQTFRGEAPTTVEEPVADVTVGALNAFAEIDELRGEGEKETPLHKRVDLYLSTSSAGGGLQMMVAGVVKEMTTESAQRAALGAGAIVMDAISADDGREEHQRISQVRHIKPDIVLLTGGVDGGSKTHVMEVAEMLLAASPRPRFGDTLKLPVIYAGNKDAAPQVKELLEKECQVSVVDNVRPTLDEENLHPAREAIHDFFLKHVMSHSPGYDKLLSWTPEPVMPTPAAVGIMVQSYAESTGKQVLCADIGGATTDVFSVFKDADGKNVFNRTVSANLGMSYSVANVLIESGTEQIARWLPYKIEESEIRDRLRNKMIRPTSIPQTLEDLWLEQAVCREALRLSLIHHRSLAVGLSGVKQSRSVADIFTQKKSRYELVDMMKLDMVIGSGGVLSHAPSRISSALMMLDGFGLQGLTQITVDSIFMLPHLGVLSEVDKDAANQIFYKDCIVNIAHAVVPVFKGRYQDGAELLKVYIDGSEKGRVRRNELKLIELPAGVKAVIKLEPLGRDINVGAGDGKVLEKEIETGLQGLILDGRNRFISFPLSESERIERQKVIFKNLGLLR